MRMGTRATTLGVAIALGAAAATAGALPPFGTAPRTRTAAHGTVQAELVRVAVGRHAAFDRIVFRFTGGTPGFRVRYVARVIQDGSGLPIALRGRRFLSIVFDPARAHPPSGAGLNVPRAVIPLFPTLRQLKLAGDFEGVVSFGAGLSKRAGFRVFTLTGPRRVVVDVAH